MKLSHTRIISETITVERSGQTIGDYINALIADSLKTPDEMVTHINVEIDNDDRIALRLLQSPVMKDTTQHNADPYNADNHVAVASSSKLKKPFLSEKGRRREDILQQHREGLLTDQEKADKLRDLNY